MFRLKTFLQNLKTKILKFWKKKTHKMVKKFSKKLKKWSLKNKIFVKENNE